MHKETVAMEIIVPILNEKDTIAEFYSRVARIGFASALIFVDNASSDGTVELLDRLPGARVIRHASNLGYGASIRDGLSATKAARVAIIDADLEYPPEALADLFAALDSHAVVYGTRFLSSAPAAMPFLRRFGNGVVSRVFNFLFHQDTTDFYTGVKALRREAVDRLNLSRNGFEHVVEMGVQLSRAGFRIHEIPVTYVPRTRGASKMRHLPELLKYVWFIARYRLGFDRGRVSPYPEAR
jgi:glycosyltransferase involved in cell wall biosynthesis